MLRRGLEGEASPGVSFSRWLRRPGALWASPQPARKLYARRVCDAPNLPLKRRLRKTCRSILSRQRKGRVDGDDGAGDEAARIGCQEQCHLRDLLGLAAPPIQRRKVRRHSDRVWDAI